MVAIAVLVELLQVLKARNGLDVNHFVLGVPSVGVIDILNPDAIPIVDGAVPAGQQVAVMLEVVIRPSLTEPVVARSGVVGMRLYGRPVRVMALAEPNVHAKRHILMILEVGVPQILAVNREGPVRVVNCYRIRIFAEIRFIVAFHLIAHVEVAQLDAVSPVASIFSFRGEAPRQHEVLIAQDGRVVRREVDLRVFVRILVLAVAARALISLGD